MRHYCVVARPSDGTVDLKVEEFQDDLKWFYSVVKCKCLDFITREINEDKYVIICDDVGALKPNHFALTSKNRTEVLFGNLIICQQHSEDLIGLSEENAKELIKYLKNNNYSY